MALLQLVVLSWAAPSAADVGGKLRVEPAPDLSAFVGRPIDQVRVELVGPLFREPVQLSSVQPGDLMTPALLRRGLRELTDTGRYAAVSAEVSQQGERLIVVVSAEPRRLVAAVRVRGSKLESAEEQRAVQLREGSEVTHSSLEDMRERVMRAHARAGYPDANVVVAAKETDDEMAVLVRVDIDAGKAHSIGDVIFRVAPTPHLPELGSVLDDWQAKPGKLLSHQKLDAAQEALVQELVDQGWYEAAVEWAVREPDRVVVKINAGPRYSFRIEGNEEMGAQQLIDHLNMPQTRAVEPTALEAALRDYYVQRGFWDARIDFERLLSEDGLRAELHGWIREGERVRLEARRFPCLSGSKTEQQLSDEIDGVLAEQFPGVAVLHPPENPSLDRALGSPSPSRKDRPLPAAPYRSYSDEAWQAVRRHLTDLYRADGYLGARVGPITVVRQRCEPHTQPGVCRTSGPPPLPVVECEAAPERSEEIRHTCVPDPNNNVRCSSEATVVLPVYAGRQAVLYDVTLTGNDAFTERQLLDEANFGLGAPFRAPEVDAALERIRELYAERGYAFALVESDLELSADGTRARLVVSINEREPVHIERIVIRGSRRTHEGLIRSRVSLKRGGLYRRSLVRRTQRQLESLGVFTSVAVALEDPGVPARRKTVVINLTEQLPQYLDIKGGFATGDGFRVGFEYGHRNLGGEAIALTLRSQLGLRPINLIPEQDVRDRYSSLDLGELLERRNTLTVGFPNTGLGPRYRFEVELSDVQDNNRDFGQTREAGAVRLQYRPGSNWWTQVGGTIEYNRAEIIGGQGLRGQLRDYVRDNPNRQIRVPEGLSLAITQNGAITWDRRDQALSATRGTYVSLGLEHVTAIPIGVEGEEARCRPETADAFAPVCSELLRYTGRIAGYVPLSDEGLALAVSLRGGVIQHLTGFSRTYPDRLFFMGGIDTIRGYPQDSLVPQDLAERVLDPNDELVIDNVVLRGGDLLINPRIELRIPVLGSFHTAIFVDSGNLWTDPSRADLLDLRYTVGSGVRLETPIGPLVFDYGFNIERLVEGFRAPRPSDRTWEDIGAFHFSIGLF